MSVLIPATESLAAGSNHGALAVVPATPGTLIGPNTERNGLNVQVDPGTAATTPILYLLLASAGTPSASNYDIAVSPTLPWDGMIGPVVYRGAVRYSWVGSVNAQVAVSET